MSKTTPVAGIMTTEFQKIISITLLVTGLVASIWHIRLLRMATNTDALNQQIEESRHRETRNLQHERITQPSDILLVETSTHTLSTTTTISSQPTPSDVFLQQTSSITEDSIEISTDPETSIMSSNMSNSGYITSSAFFK